MFKVLFLSLLFANYTVLSQEGDAQIAKKITNIQQKLLVLKGKLNKAYGKESVLIEQLEKQDKVINDISKKVNTSKSIVLEIQIKVQDLDNNIKQKSYGIKSQQNQIIELLKLQIYLNHDKTLKMLLVKPNHNSSEQTKHQIKYLQHKLYNLIKEVTDEIKTIKLLKDKQLILNAEENEKQQVLIGQQDELLNKRKQRLEILNTLKVEISKHQTESEELNGDQKRLRSLLLEVKNLLSDLPVSLGANLSFAKLKGKMKKPVKGEYIRSFRSRRAEGTKWNGIVIKAGFGDDIRSIAYGRVAFADWLRGYGMLVIIDHHDSYMSLYGFNESINVEAGDWVDNEQVIATIGNSGTLATPAVYFEIRKDAKPLNPKNWVK